MKGSSQQESPESREALKLLQRLLDTHKSYAAVGRLLGSGTNEPSRWKNEGHVPPRWVEKMQELVNGEAPPDSLQSNIAAIKNKFPKAPADLLELSARTGSVNKAATTAGISPPDFYKIARGNEATALNQGRIDKALERARKSKDVGRLKSGRHYGSQADLTGLPEELQELVRKKGGLNHAANAIGYRSVGVLKQIQAGAHDYTEEIADRVRRALEGDETAPGPATARAGRSMSEDPDTGEMGIAIVVIETRSLEPIYDAGQAMGGEWIFRMRIDGQRWLLICKIEDQDKLHSFKTIVRLVAEKVVTP